MRTTFSNLFASPPSLTKTLGNDYVRTIIIEGVNDVFDPDAIWALPRPFGSDKTRLKGILTETIFRFGSQGTPSVELELPQKAYVHDKRLRGGGYTENLKLELTKKHFNDFGKWLDENDRPRYRVLFSDDLKADQVRVRIGAAVYVPPEDEAVAWKIETSLDINFIGITTPSLLATRQRLFILGGSANTSSRVCPHWPFKPEAGLVIINCVGKDELDLSDDPLGCLQIDYDERFQCHIVKAKGEESESSARLYVRATRLAPQELPAVPSRPMPAKTVVNDQSVALKPANFAVRIEPTLEALVQQQQSPSLTADAPMLPETLVTVEPACAVSVPENVAWQDAEPTFFAQRQVPPEQDIDDKTYVCLAPAHRASLTLEGLAIQRPSQFQAEGVRSLQWGFDQHGGVVSPQCAAGEMIISIGADDAVSIQTKSGHRQLKNDEPVCLPSGAVVKMTALPAPLNAVYLGFMKLPPGKPLPLVPDQLIGVGRHLQTLATLQALAGKGFLVDGKDSDGDRMGLSRRHFELQAVPEGLMVRAVGNNTVAHLDAQMCFVGTITADQPTVLENGECLVVGHYVWRFNA